MDTRIHLPTPGQAPRGSSHARGLRGALLGMLAAIGLLTAGTAAFADEHDFPLNVIDYEGTEVVIEAPPERIVSLSPANTEIVFALGAGDRLVGGTDFDDFPPEAADLPDVATFTGVILERLVDLDPDLVVAAANFGHDADIVRLRELGIPVMVVYAESVDEVLADIELIGRAIGAHGAAEALTTDLRAELDDISTAALAAGTTPRTFYQVASEPETYGPAEGSFLADMVALGGGLPITTGDRVDWSISVERLVEADPEIIIVGDALYGVCPADVMARPAWTNMTAVREGDVRAVVFADVTRPGPRLPEAVAAIARAIHPDVELPAFPPLPDPCPAA